MMLGMSTGRDKDDDTQAPSSNWSARQAARTDRPLPPPPLLLAQNSPPVYYVEIREERSLANGTEAKMLFAATGKMEDIAPSLSAISRKFGAPWWAFWRPRAR
jgi:hypothetical protein